MSYSATAKALAQLQQQFSQAASSQDWQLLRQLDRQLLKLVQQLSCQGLKPQFAAELAGLKQQYQSVLAMAKAELGRSEAKMQQFNQNKAAVVAYRQTLDGVS
ncbi:hypothetical protein MN202_05510 [Rheinheimera muenzenbergensis]|uniref:Protein FliT n=1 Tax=Rheinheimera muenzenbergensis TaxID=1193628 RepID=A0ABU8C429_9GAMM